MTACKHDWHWLGHHHFVVDKLGVVVDYENAVCRKCKMRAWLHGHAPTTGPATRSLAPTTERD